jgi:hypothetical protein
MVFVSWGFHIKNPQTSRSLEAGMLFVNQWRLPLLFLISGAAARFSLRRRTSGQFAIDRLKRLGIPLVFGMLVIVPPQVYYERLTQGATYKTFFHYLPDAFKGRYPEGNLSWHHLWYLAYVLVYALISVPIFKYAMSEKGALLIKKVAAFFERPGRVFLFIVPLIVSDILLRPHWPTTHNLVEDWANLTFSYIIFLYGFVICSSDSFSETLQRHRLVALVLGMISATALYTIFWPHEGQWTPLFFVAFCLVKNLNLWSWMIAILGFARIYLNRPGRTIRYANEAVYPFYVLHQTVIIALGYRVIQWEMGIAAKFTILAAGTFVITWLIYESIIRRTNILRPLFGMKSLQRIRWTE